MASASQARSAHVKATLRSYTSPQAKYELVLEEMRRTKRQLRVAPPKPAPAPPSHNRIPKEPEIRFKTFHHSGVWVRARRLGVRRVSKGGADVLVFWQEHNKVEDMWMWSDTGSYVQESEGDVVKLHNPNRYDYSSPWRIY
jgi:hypothetical protein